MAIKRQRMKKMYLEISSSKRSTLKNNLNHNRSQNDENVRTWTRSTRRTRNCANRRGVAAGWLLRRGDLLLDGGGDHLLDGGGDPLADNGCGDHKGHMIVTTVEEGVFTPKYLDDSGCVSAHVDNERVLGKCYRIYKII